MQPSTQQEENIKKQKTKSLFFKMPAACIGTFAPFFPLFFTSGDGSTVRSS